MARKSIVLIIEDDRALREELTDTFELEEYEVWQAQDCASAKKVLEQAQPDAILLDIQLPDGDGLELLPWILREHAGIPVVIGTAHATYDRAVRAIRQGAYDFIEKTANREELLLPIRNAVEKRRLERVQAGLRRQLRGDNYLIAESGIMKELLARIDRIAATDEKVLLTGESGTGKELVAEYLHSQSKRADGPYIPFNCAAFPETLVESELFGYEQGSHATAYSRKDGLFHAADGGTIFLDEIGDMSTSVQTKLLRVLENGMVRRIGQNAEAKVDVRVIAATNKDLAARVKLKEFREDLYERLNVFTFNIPPLRERIEDMFLILERELAVAATKFDRRPPALSPEAKATLAALSWEGNVRTVQRLAKRLTAYVAGDTVYPEDIRRVIGQPDHEPETFRQSRVRWEREWFSKLLMATGGNRTRAAQIADIDPKTLYTKLRDLGLGEISPD
ncbi:sigma-54-dependent Fis family transcriptional regulator [bacterium]|nr:sigma-54-dependent Fis family transcriptional regulator [bacterium]